MDNENTKFDEVVTDIIKAIANISYNDLEKEAYRVELLINFNKLCENYPSYLNAISILRKEDDLNKSVTYSKKL